jgi:enterochelin esterase-like enzyme
MSFFTFAFGVLVVLAAAAAVARAQKKQRVPRPKAQPGGEVKLSFAAPGAKQVVLQFEGVTQTLPMTRDKAGVWSIKVGPLEPGLYGYTFIADGVNVLDPNNPVIKPNLIQPQNMVLVPGAPSALWEIADVPHGVVHHNLYKSNVVGEQSEYFVYTPPGLDPRSDTKYPVLYLLHGLGAGADAWTAIGKANVILDNLLAQNKIEPMIVVMPLSYGTLEILNLSGKGWQDPALRQENFDKFSKVLITEILPQVEASYPVSSDGNKRAIAGFSMGGAEALLIGLNCPEKFAYIGAFGSGGLPEDYSSVFPGLDAESAKQLKTLWIACGTSDSLIATNRKLKAWLKANGVAFADVETPGGHTWMTWRENLIALAPVLFTNK